ncbi:hypothetical protein FG386_002218 [Cryptosporidium ryanae]|uniref:uncharacterized protein n=1 Tax=Cryptosporidium ryanae TaxID=515981 RepID=UPI003519D8CE|nr:hypothetical protein FG386_002218 [Cryptosporidium ryanae]
MHYSGFNNQNGALHHQVQVIQGQPNFSPIPSYSGRGIIGGMGGAGGMEGMGGMGVMAMQAPKYYEEQIYGGNGGYIENQRYQQNKFQQNQNVHGQHMPQYSMIQMQAKQQNEKNVSGRARSQTRGPFSRTAAARSTTPTPNNIGRNTKQRDMIHNDDLNIVRRSTETIDESCNNIRNPSYTQIEKNYYGGEYDINNYHDSQNMCVPGQVNKEQSRQLNIVNPDQIPIQKVSAPLEPTPTHVARMNKMRLMGLTNNNPSINQLTPTYKTRNDGLRDGGHNITRQPSLIPQYYQDKYQQKSSKNSNNTASVFRDSSPKVLGSYVSRQLEEEVTRLRYLVENQTKKISLLEIKNKELENELISNRNYKELYEELQERTNLGGNYVNCEQNSDENEKETNGSEVGVIEDEFELEKQIGENNTVMQKMSSTKDQKATKIIEKRHSMFSNIHQFSAESALRKAGVPPGRPSYIYRPPNHSELIDVKLAEFHNSRSSLIRWSKVSSTIYLFGTTQVQLRLSRGSLLAKPESSEWGNGNFWPIEKFVAVFEPIERAKMPNN